MSDTDRINRRLDELAALKDGWLNGDGAAPDPETIEFIRTHLPRMVALGLPMPRLFPGADGFVVAEWDIDGVAVSARLDATRVRPARTEIPDA